MARTLLEDFPQFLKKKMVNLVEELYRLKIAYKLSPNSVWCIVLNV